MGGLLLHVLSTCVCVPSYLCVACNAGISAHGCMLAFAGRAGTATMGSSSAQAATPLGIVFGLTQPVRLHATPPNALVNQPNRAYQP